MLRKIAKNSFHTLPESDLRVAEIVNGTDMLTKLTANRILIVR